MVPLISETDLPKLNSLTKYPSIPTYHALGAKGRLTETVQVPFACDGIVTEKIDGANARLICTMERVLAGSREDLLWATGDLIHNPAMGIVPAIRSFASALLGIVPRDSLLVIYGEVYGKNIGSGAKNYSVSGKAGFRVFDAFRMTGDAVRERLAAPPEHIAAWRENGGQPFMTVPELDALASDHGLERVPALAVVPAPSMPVTIAEAAAFLSQFSKSAAQLDSLAHGQSEGVVIRTADRRQIAKLRFEDYERASRK